ncbi:MAG: ATP-binding protein [Nitrospirota bacterium]
MADDDIKKTKSELIKDLKSLRKKIHSLESFQQHQHIKDEWENTFNTIRDLIFITDGEGVVRHANRSLADKLGFQPYDLVGKPCWEIFKCDYDKKENCSLKKIQQGLSIRRHEVKIPFFDMWVLAHVYAVYTPSGKIDYIIHTYRDITEHKRLEEQLLQFNKVEAIARLAGGVAHEFNNLLTGIIGNLSLVQSQINMDSEEYRFVERADTAAQKAAELIKRLLAFSSKLQTTYNLISVNEEILKAVSLLSETIDPRIEIIVNPDKNLWTVMADPVLISNMLISLIMNARDAISECFEGLFRNDCKEKESFFITIKTENIEMDEKYCKLYSSARHGEYVLIAISDNGIGMDIETQKHIFEPFFTTRGMDKGKGLGLATIYGIVKQWDGWINVSSEIGKGTTFKVYLPRAIP